MIWGFLRVLAFDESLRLEDLDMNIDIDIALTLRIFSIHY